MAIVINYAGASLRRPGAYSRLRVAQGAAAEAQLGILALIGEAEEGDDYSLETGPSAYTFNPEQYGEILEKFGSGELVNAARLSLQPGNDEQIVGGAQQLLVLKTNTSVKASLALATNYGTLKAKKAGTPGNNVSVEISDTAPVTGVAEVTSITCVADVSSSLNSQYFLYDTPYVAYYVWINVAAAGVDPEIAGRTGIMVAIAEDDIAADVATAVAAAMNASIYIGAAAVGAVVTATAAHTGAAADAVDGAATTGFTFSVTTQGVTAVAAKKVVTIENSISGISEVSDTIGGQSVLQIWMTDTGASAATLTIDATKIMTTVTGGTAPSLSIPKTQFNTINQLVDFINSKSGYVAVLGDSSQQNEPLSVLDRVAAQDIKAIPYQMLRNLQDMKNFFGDSGLVDFTATAFLGLPVADVKTFLFGGVKGATTNAKILGALDALMKSRVNFIVPLFSRDATADIADGLTDDASSYTIDSVHIAVRTHCSQNSTVKGRKERQGFLGYKGTFDNAKTKSFNLSNARIALMFQDVDVQDANGEIVTAQPHMLAVINAAMRAAAVVGLPLLYKKANVNGFISQGFDPEVDADEAIDANLCFLEKAPGGGFRFVIDNSTYGQIKDAWIYNRPAVLYAADTACFAIRLNVETFIGQRNSDVTPETVKNLLISVMDGLRTSGIIVPDAQSGGKGYTNLTVSFAGNIIKTSVTLVLVEGFEFALNDITVTRAAA